jgi:hypothetical protein
LRQLNVAAAGLVLAAVVSVVFGRLMGGAENFFSMALVAGGLSLLPGLGWGRWARKREKAWKKPLTWAIGGVFSAAQSWILMGFLILLDGDFGHGLDYLTDRWLTTKFRYELFLGFVGASAVAFPMSLLFLLFYMVDQRSGRGLASEERGDTLFGLTAALLSVAALWIALRCSLGRTADSFLGPEGVLGFRSSGLNLAGKAWVGLVPLLGLATGVTAAAWSAWRAGQRWRFVAGVKSGKLSGYRVEVTARGRVLVRVASHDPGYRGAEVDEEIVDLDDVAPTMPRAAS